LERILVERIADHAGLLDLFDERLHAPVLRQPIKRAVVRTSVLDDMLVFDSLIGYGSDRQQAIMRLERALGEYFVAGIKTNISLFQLILRDADFQEGKLDTGYLDRLLAKGNEDVTAVAAEPKIEALDTIAAIAAGIFAVLDPVSPGSKNGDTGGPTAIPSNWKQKGRSEALR